MPLLLLNQAHKVFINDGKILELPRNNYLYFTGQFIFAMNFTTVNGTGTGELAISIDTVDGIPVGDDEFNCNLPGTYNVGWTLNAEPSSDCETPPCEMWLPGTYNVTMG